MPFLSPGVQTREVDRTFNINNIVANATGYVGLFRWGPVNEVVNITTNESELVRRFGQPDNETTLFFHAAQNYLLYANPLTIIRVAGDNAVNAVSAGQTAIRVENTDEYQNVDLTGISFIGKYPGSLANNIKVSIADDTGFTGWDYEDEFTNAPEAGEMNVVVVDEDGFISGEAGTILETYSLLTTNSGDKKTDGTSAYINKVLEDQSNWILVGDSSQIDFTDTASPGIYEVSLEGGVDDNVVANADFDSAYGILGNKELIDIVRIFTTGAPTASKGVAIDTCATRQDAIAFVAPELDDVYNTDTAVDNVVEHVTTEVNKATSYEFYVDNWKLVHDKYNDRNIWIPCDGDAAALHARTFAQNEPWFSPAGYNRGQLLNVIRLAWSPNESQRNTLYKNNVNSIVSFPGEGTILYGDKTGLKRPSVFTRINVRTLFIVVKKNIANAAKYQLFEFNDAITRGVFSNAARQYLGQVQARRGLEQPDGYRVVCDESNNTTAVIQANEFVGDIYLKPNLVINFITLNFVATPSGISFDEIEG